MNLGEYAGACPLPGPKTENPFDGGALVDDHALGVEDHYDVGRVTYEGPEPPFAPPEGLFRHTTLGYVGGVDAQEVPAKDGEHEPLVEKAIDRHLARDRPAA